MLSCVNLPPRPEAAGKRDLATYPQSLISCLYGFVKKMTLCHEGKLEKKAERKKAYLIGYFLHSFSLLCRRGKTHIITDILATVKFDIGTQASQLTVTPVTVTPVTVTFRLE